MTEPSNTELFELYIEKVRTLLAQLDADVQSRDTPVDVEWNEMTAVLRRSLGSMGGLTAEQLGAEFMRQRVQLARLGEMYLQITRGPDP